MKEKRRTLAFSALLLSASWLLSAHQPVVAADPATGPQTEKRFPPLQVPEGFRATLFACDPLVEYPSVIARGPRAGTLFVAHDYVTGLGVEIVRRDEVRLLADTDGDGYADKSTVYAGGFNSIQGLAYDNGTVFVMHAPQLTALRDTDADGVADSRRDLVAGLGLPPQENPNRLHCANGVVSGHDGWLYLALGDRGCDVRRSEGDRLLFQQGGILRCRADGRDLHVFAGGLRNIYDVALDDELNVFVRDNENDGGDYMIRVCRSFFGADHGYPYLYYERPQEGLSPLADLGRGSSAGGTAYLETAFPEPFRDSLYFCEWGRAVVRYPRTRAGSHFAEMTELDFAAGAENDPYGFKPTDLVVDYDGSLLISDWADGQRPQRGRGRIYRITYTGDATKKAEPPPSVSAKADVATVLAALHSSSDFARATAQRELARRGVDVLPAVEAAMKSGDLRPLGRLHAVWLLAELKGADAIDRLFDVAATDEDPRIRMQAVRALADLTDPVLVQHRLEAGRGDERIAARLAALISTESDPRLILEVIVTLARLRWLEAPGWLSERWETLPLDPSIEHAAMQLLRRCGNWPAVVKLLDRPGQETERTELRILALRALADQAETVVADGLIERLESDPSAARRKEYIDVLARVYQQPAAWTYWGFRPAPRPANSVAWERTEPIGQALDRAMADADASVRLTALTRMQREEIPVRLAALGDWLGEERDADRVLAILQELGNFQAAEVREMLERVVRDKSHSEANRLTALASLAKGLPPDSAEQLLTVARALEEGTVLAAAIGELGTRRAVDGDRFVLDRLDSRDAAVRAAAIETLGERQVSAAGHRAVALLADDDVRVRRAAAFVAGKLKVPDAAPRLRELAASTDRETCRRSLVALLALKDPHAVAPAAGALMHSETQLAALEYLEQFGGAEQASALMQLAATSRSSDVLTGIVRALSHWETTATQNSDGQHELERALATVHWQSGVLLHWFAAGPVAAEDADRLTRNLTPRSAAELPGAANRIASGTEGTVSLAPATSKGTDGRTSWLAVSHVRGDRPTDVEFLSSATGEYRVWLNGNQVFHRDKAAPYQPDSDRYDARLAEGNNRLVVRVDGGEQNPRFHLRFRTKSSQAEHERLIALALKDTGSDVRGREIFFAAEKSQCIKCHRLGEEGGRIGPDLTGIGSRYSKIHLVESLLEPSRTIAPSYATLAVVLNSGRVLTGVNIAETADTLTLGDQEGKTHVIPRSEIELLRGQDKSTMPEGLEKRLSDREFLDLTAFLLSQKQRRTTEVTP